MSNWAWVDVETTGVNIEKDKVLEVAVIVTNNELVELAELDIVIVHHDQLPELNPFVLDMHTRNGLWADITQRGVTPERAEQWLGNFLTDCLGGRKQLIQAGSGVSHFDSKFITKAFPEASKLLTFWTNDAAILKRGYESAGWKTPKKGRKDTRGLDDVRQHIEEWKFYTSRFMKDA